MPGATPPHECATLGFCLMRRPSLFRRCAGTLDRLARCILRSQVRWQGLAQAWQGQEVERLRKAAQSSMAAQKRQRKAPEESHQPTLRGSLRSLGEV